jgi:hypothetical protein
MMKFWRIAIVLLAAEIFVVVVAIGAQAQQTNQSLGVGVSIPPLAKTQGSANKPQPDLHGTTPIVVQALPAPLSEKDAADIQFRERLAKNDRLLILITGVLAVAVLLQWGALGYQSWLLRKSIRTQTADMGRYITEAARTAGAMERAADSMAKSVASAAESIAAAKTIAERQNLVPELAAMSSNAARHSDAD